MHLSIRLNLLYIVVLTYSIPRKAVVKYIF